MSGRLESGVESRLTRVTPLSWRAAHSHGFGNTASFCRGAVCLRRCNGIQTTIVKKDVCNAATACRSATVLREADAVCNALAIPNTSVPCRYTFTFTSNRINPAGHKIAKVLSRMKFVPRMHMMGNQLIIIIRNRKSKNIDACVSMGDSFRKSLLVPQLLLRIRALGAY
jgi:hypothetical protein